MIRYIMVRKSNAAVVKLVYTLSSGGSGSFHVSSNLISCTNAYKVELFDFFIPISIKEEIYEFRYYEYDGRTVICFCSTN